jgi:valyl-tRNA synthetase
MPSRSRASRPALPADDLNRPFEPARVEPRWYEHWLRLDLFRARPESGRRPFSIAIPPPNVTGSLHMGHALIYTLQDIVIRRRRMQGLDALWLPGTDHAGIATQLMVERALEAEGTSRLALGRERFERRAWRWKEEYGERVLGQLRRLGCSCDWSRTRFTLDPGLSRAVREAFVRLHAEGLIYRGQYIVNWCPRCRTALSDLEVAHEETAGRLYVVRYPGLDGGEGVRVATTRPETLLGDTAVAVHPRDARYAGLAGTRLRLPILGRDIPVVADDWVDPKFGTGAVKVTPAHDPNDFRIAGRHALPAVRVIDEEGRMTAEAGPFAGLDRFDCRRQIVERLRAEGLLQEVREHTHAVGRCQRCRTVLEPSLSTQWFVRVAPLAGPALQAVRRGRIRFVPAQWIRTYSEWMENLHDWCISRQLWWGHRIPAWHCRDCAHIEVARRAPRACPRCRGPVEQDADVLDTWFSSALWPFSTLGWPRRTADLRRYYPTSALLTGFDIIFFWVARMIMMGLKLTGEVPFREVYFSGLVRDAQGQKMSKTRGNVIDPLEVMERYGTDAVRFTLAALASPGSDIPLAAERMEGYRAFANKLWNAGRFVLQSLRPGEALRLPPGPSLTRAQRWILERFDLTARAVAEALDAYRFDQAAHALYHFIWHEFCDWFIELAKPDLAGTRADAPEGARARAVLAHLLDGILRLLHPFMPFITEDLWQRLPAAARDLSRGARPRRGKGAAGRRAPESRAGRALAAAPYPRPGRRRSLSPAARSMEQVLDLIGRVRNVRAESGIDPGRRIELLLHAADPARRRLLEECREPITRLARCAEVRIVDDLRGAGPSARGVARGAEFAIPLASALDLQAERERLRREIERLQRDMAGHQRKLESPDFLGKAPAAVVARTRSIVSDLREKKERLERTLGTLGGPEGPP